MLVVKTCGKRKNITSDSISPLGIEWPLWSNMQYTNMFLFIDGKPGTKVTVTDSFKRLTKAKWRSMWAKQLEFTPKGHNPYNITSVSISGGMVGAQWTQA